MRRGDAGAGRRRRSRRCSSGRASLARQLKTGQTPLLGLLVPSMANPMYGVIAREVETFAQERFGHRLLIGSTYPRPRPRRRPFFDDLLAHGVRHVIVISSLADRSATSTTAVGATA